MQQTTPAAGQAALPKARTAHGITHTTDVRVRGNHLAAQNDEPESRRLTAADRADAASWGGAGSLSEADLQASDTAYAALKNSGALERRNDDRAMKLQMQAQARADWRAS